MDELDLDAIEARTNAATEGPWSVYSTIQAESVVVGASGRLTATIATPSTAPEDYGFANAEFIAHARTDVPALVAEVRRLRAEVEHEKGGWDYYDAAVSEIALRGMERDDARAEVGSLREELQRQEAGREIERNMLWAAMEEIRELRGI